MKNTHVSRPYLSLTKLVPARTRDVKRGFMKSASLVSEGGTRPNKRSRSGGSEAANGQVDAQKQHCDSAVD